MSIENHVESRGHKRDQLGWITGFFRRKKRSPQEINTEHNTCEDLRLIRRNKANNLHLFLSEIMRKLKHSFKEEKHQHDKRLLEKKRRKLQRSLSTRDHFFLERMVSISQQRTHQEHYDNEKHLSEMLNNGDSDQNLARSKQIQRRIVSLPEYSSPFSSPGRIWSRNSTVLLRSSSDDFISKSNQIVSLPEYSSPFSSPGRIWNHNSTVVLRSSSDGFISKSNQIVDDEISKVEVCDIEKENSNEESLPQLSLLSVASPSHYISKTEECKLVLEPLFIEYEISSVKGEAKTQPYHQMNVKESVFKYVKAVLDAIDSNCEELYLKTEFIDQLLNPALLINIPFYPNQLCGDHELLFDCINEVLFELCRFPQWVSFVKPRTQVFLPSVESIVQEVQKEVYCRLLPSRFGQLVDQIVREDMAKSRNWLDIRCDLECIGFETSELVLNELLEELMLDLCSYTK